MRNDWKYYTTHDGISSIRNVTLDEKNYYRMKVFMKNYFKDRFTSDAKKQTSLLYSIVMSVSGEKNGKSIESPFLCDVSIDQHKFILSWSVTLGVSLTADTREGNYVIRELYKVLKDSNDHEFWKISI